MTLVELSCKKCEYALLALLELNSIQQKANHFKRQIAAQQNIPGPLSGTAAWRRVEAVGEVWSKASVGRRVAISWRDPWKDYASRGFKLLRGLDPSPSEEANP